MCDTIFDEWGRIFENDCKNYVGVGPFIKGGGGAMLQRHPTPEECGYLNMFVLYK